jgi:hypothetical protein
MGLRVEQGGVHKTERASTSARSGEPRGCPREKLHFPFYGRNEQRVARQSRKAPSSGRPLHQSVRSGPPVALLPSYPPDAPRSLQPYVGVVVDATTNPAGPALISRATVHPVDAPVCLLPWRVTGRTSQSGAQVASPRMHGLHKTQHRGQTR